MTSTGVPYTVTRDGYSIIGENLSTNSTFRSWTDSTGSASIKSTDKYPFKTFNANIDLANDSLIINFMMGDSAVVTAGGRTYPDYTSY